ncbi:F-box protein SNE-like [Canna indica]|uniref:F-box protein SNE-like n=1 Tax=Canna indica TaxID=4628 RepID=A0AAQ3KRB8_9LILI|nr:F-box protein SNE-like [Canna indica]
MSSAYEQPLLLQQRGREAEEEETLAAITDNADLMAEVLGRLDGRSLAAAGCVCRLWAAVSRRESVWEAVCGQHVAGGAAAGAQARPVVAALGGYRRLYRLCLGPALDRLGAGGWPAARLSLSLSLSLFSIECYERRLGRERGHPLPASLLFLGHGNPVDVS